jgi:nucleoside-diphosphate-sugar epimerase
VEDLADILLYCLENRIEGTHLIAGSNTNTVSEMLETICHILLPDKKPEYKSGDNCHDQVIEHSQALLKGRSFEDAICDLKKELKM